ncbi:MAG: DUF4760 domain-containing protein [Gammaproteobacteria bacterium]
MDEATPLTIAATSLLSVAALGSALAATIAVRLQRRWHSADAFFRIAQVFETPDFRQYRSLIYNLNRDEYSSWSDEQVNAVNAWCAHLDLVATLVQEGQINERALLNMYGDVLLRTVYQIAPYCNHQITIRGRQFLLPLRILTTQMIKLWRKRAQRKRYPITIGFPAQPALRVNADLFDSDESVLDFRVTRGKLR